MLLSFLVQATFMNGIKSKKNTDALRKNTILICTGQNLNLSERFMKKNLEG
jgi:hypothetical protein